MGGGLANGSEGILQSTFTLIVVARPDARNNCEATTLNFFVVFAVFVV
jgi:hypothetical protein